MLLFVTLAMVCGRYKSKPCIIPIHDLHRYSVLGVWIIVLDSKIWPLDSISFSQRLCPISVLDLRNFVLFWRTLNIIMWNFYPQFSNYDISRNCLFSCETFAEKTRNFVWFALVASNTIVSNIGEFQNKKGMGYKPRTSIYWCTTYLHISIFLLPILHHHWYLCKKKKSFYN